MKKIRKECPYCEKLRTIGKDMTVEIERGYKIYTCCKCRFEMEREIIQK